MEETLSTLQDLVVSGWRFWLEDGQLRYRAPATAVDDNLLAHLRQRKAEILTLLEESPEQFDLCPLSYGQRAMWFLWKLAPESHAYNLSMPIRLPAGTAPDAWRAACEALSARHPQLRSSFRWQGSQPVQRVHPPGEVDWQEVTADGWDDARLTERMLAEHRRPFDLEHGPPFRCCWYAHDDGATLLLTSHHIVNDAWSHGIMLGELELMANGADPGPAPATTYHDYVREESARIEGAEGELLWAYWKRQLAAPLPVLELPYDRPRPSAQSFRGDAVSTTLPGELVERLEKLAKLANGSISSAILAAFGALLMRAGGQRDLLIGMPLLGRRRSEHADIIGYFVDPVVVRLRLNAGQSFLAFFAEAHQTVLEAIDHGSFPFALLVERIAPQRDPGRSPLFDVMFNHLKHSGHRSDRLDSGQLPQVEGQFDLNLAVTEQPDRLELELRYSKDVFRHDTVSRMLDDFVALLERVSRDPEQPLLSPAASQAPDAGSDLADRRNKRGAAPAPEAASAEGPAPSAPAEAAADRAAPLSPVERRLAAIWRELLALEEEPGPNDDFFQLGGHSLRAVHLAVRIEEVFGVTLPVAQVLRTRTLSELARGIETARVLPEDAPDILVPIRETGTSPPLVLIPGSGGNILYLEPLARRLGSHQPIWGLQALGLESKEAPIPGRVEEIAARYLELVTGEPRLAGAIALAGHSFGALVAFEMARQLQAAGGQQPLLVGIIDLVAPGGLPEEKIRTWDERGWLEHIGVRMEKLFDIDLELHTPAFEHATQEARIESMVDRLTGAGLLPASVGSRQFARFAEIYRSNSLSAIRYSPDPLEPPARVTLFKAKEEDPDIQDQLRGPAEIDERTMGWDRYSVLPVEVIEVGGTHLTMLTEPDVEELAARLSEALTAPVPRVI